ncbi:MAG TPA: ZIP family metal transporter [Thermoplasmata archaeon]|nr:ZIP family metal transporter [Thermoplasmata archaeon]
MADVATLALWALVTGGTPLILAAVPILRTRLTDRTTHVMLGLSAGILLGLSFLNVLPESFEAADTLGLPPQAVPLGAAAGFFVLMLIERQMFHRGHPPAPDHRDDVEAPHREDGHAIHPFGTLALSALTIHGLVDGFVIPLGFELGAAAGTVIVLAVSLHQIPDSFAALAVGLGSKRSRRAAIGFVLATAIDTPLGILVGILFLGIGASWVAIGLAFSAGTFLFVSAADLIPELQHRSRSLLVSLSIILGFAAIGLLAFLPE